MADATAAPATGTSTTPTQVAPEPSTPAVAAQATAPTTTPASATTEVSPSAATAPAATDGPAPTTPAEPAAPLFTIPEDIKLAPEATTKFDSFLRGKLSADGKVVLTSQEVTDHFIEQAKDANTRWAKQMEDLDKSNADACKARFTPAQLSQAEAAVGFASSIDPGFREFAKRQLNDPVFVNFMREIGERLS